MIIDFHTHCFTDALAPRAMANLTEQSLYPPHYDGTLCGLKTSMKEAGIDVSVILNIATAPHQCVKVNNWAIASNREDGIISFGSVHPDYNDWFTELKRLKSEGVKGIKFHPDFQGFFVGDKRAYVMYEKIAENDMIMVFHCGHDLVLRNKYMCEPKDFAHVVKDFSGAKIVGAHLGGQDMWNEVFEYIAPLDVYVDTSFGFKFLTEEEIARFIGLHGEDKILFGTDTPWQRQSVEVAEMRSFIEDEILLEKIFSGNAKSLLGI
ncbi:MAG: amidohydrolase family protein [Clostridia bacterium]|nr:amidohydrolase family protein [Clostridia bacterium]